MNSSVMSNTRLWNAYSNVRCIGWAELLEEWSDTLQTPSQVLTFLENLGAASSPNSMYKPTYLQLTTFLNHEQTALKWFLYEAIARGWMWGDVRFDFVQRLVDDIENLDSCFPQFPGSPWTHTTIRNWLNDNLAESELRNLQIMPPLVPLAQSYSYTIPGYSTPQRGTRPASVNAPSRPLRQMEPRANNSYRFSKVEFRIVRDQDSVGKDDCLTIENNGDSYTVRYTDSDSKLKFRTEGLGRYGTIDSLRKTLRFLTIDDEPFQYLQVSIPSMPTILVKPENLTSQTRDLIYDSVEMTMDNWPMTV